MLLELKLNRGNIIKVLNTWPAAVLRYSKWILDWTKKLEYIDRKATRL